MTSLITIESITQRMTEIEELRANGDLSQHVDEELSHEYDCLADELESLHVVKGNTFSTTLV